MFGANAELTEYFDGPRGSYRMAAFVDGQLTGALFIGPAEATPHWDAVKALFEAESVDDAQRRGMLSGKSTDGLADPGPVICACFGVGLNVIREAIASGQAANVEDIGKALRAGTNCGSCLPELKKIVSQKIGDDERVAQTA
jgi:assimilatory nitrate reductase catalytic subunit